MDPKGKLEQLPMDPKGKLEQLQVEPKGKLAYFNLVVGGSFGEREGKQMGSYLWGAGLNCLEAANSVLDCKQVGLDKAGQEAYKQAVGLNFSVGG